MTNKLQEHDRAQLTLSLSTAAEMMMPNPVSIRDVATIPEALALLTNKGFGAAPVIDVMTPGVFSVTPVALDRPSC